MKKRNLRHKGFENYETWLMAWWLNADNFASAFCRESAARSRIRSAKCSVKESAQVLLAWDIKMEVENRSPQEESVFTDLLAYALQSVNWHEVADKFLSEFSVDKKS